MSERYATCGLCKGLGEVPPNPIQRIEIETPDGRHRLETDAELWDRIKKDRDFWGECGRCGGTGFSGEIQD